MAGENTPLLRNSILKAIILPRQARDKHRESTQKKRLFSRSVDFKAEVQFMASDRLRRRSVKHAAGQWFWQGGGGPEEILDIVPAPGNRQSNLIVAHLNPSACRSIYDA